MRKISGDASSSEMNRVVGLGPRAAPHQALTSPAATSTAWTMRVMYDFSGPRQPTEGCATVGPFSDLLTCTGSNVVRTTSSISRISCPSNMKNILPSPSTLIFDLVAGAGVLETRKPEAIRSELKDSSRSAAGDRDSHKDEFIDGAPHRRFIRVSLVVFVNHAPLRILTTRLIPSRQASGSPQRLSLEFLSSPHLHSIRFGHPERLRIRNAGEFFRPSPRRKALYSKPSLRTPRWTYCCRCSSS
jgi:hypothetical protein